MRRKKNATMNYATIPATMGAPRFRSPIRRVHRRHNHSSRVTSPLSRPLPNHHPHVSFASPIFVLCFLWGVVSGARDVKTAMPAGAPGVTFACDSASWIKEDLNKVDAVISLGTQLAHDAPGGKEKYLLTKDGKELTVRNLLTSDSGVFKCKSYKYSLTVAQNPTCEPTDVTFREGVEQLMTCGHIFVNAGATKPTDVAAPPRFDWLINDQVALSVEPTEYLAAVAAALPPPAVTEAEADGVTARRTAEQLDYGVDFRLSPQFTHHGQRLQCVLEYPHWNASFPKPSCGIEKMDVKFEPRLDCPPIQYLNENDSRHEAFCEILGNPRPTEESIFWKTDNNDRFYVSRRDRSVRERGIRGG